MRRLLLLAGGIFVPAAVAFAAATATRTVAIRSNGFAPASVTVTTGDTVRWRNDDTRNHQVVSDTGAFASPILRPRQAWPFTFQTAGTYRYRDGLNRALRGTVVVRQGPSVTLTASMPIITFGQQLHMSGVVSSRRENETVTIFAKAYPQASFVEVARVLTTAGGAWDYFARPTILTSYQVRFRTVMSAETTIQVRPRVTLASARAYFFARVSGSRNFGGRIIYLQRRGFSQWINVARYRLGPRSGRLMRKPRRSGTYRAFITVNQAGEGYLAGWSGTQRIRAR
jgi:plastocyanin